MSNVMLQGKQYSCSPIENGTVMCAVGNPMIQHQEAIFVIRLDPSGVTTTAEKLNITIRVNTYVSFNVGLDLFLGSVQSPNLTGNTCIIINTADCNKVAVNKLDFHQ